jgi:hypothetical protein
MLVTRLIPIDTEDFSRLTCLGVNGTLHYPKTLNGGAFEDLFPQVVANITTPTFTGNDTQENYNTAVEHYTKKTGYKNLVATAIMTDVFYGTSGKISWYPKLGQEVVSCDIEDLSGFIPKKGDLVYFNTYIKNNIRNTAIHYPVNAALEIDFTNRVIYQLASEESIIMLKDADGVRRKGYATVPNNLEIIKISISKIMWSDTKKINASGFQEYEKTPMLFLANLLSKTDSPTDYFELHLAEPSVTTIDNLAVELYPTTDFTGAVTHNIPTDSILDVDFKEGCLYAKVNKNFLNYGQFK